MILTQALYVHPTISPLTIYSKEILENNPKVQGLHAKAWQNISVNILCFLENTTLETLSAANRQGLESAPELLGTLDPTAQETFEKAICKKAATNRPYNDAPAYYRRALRDTQSSRPKVAFSRRCGMSISKA